MPERLLPKEIERKSTITLPAKHSGLQVFEISDLQRKRIEDQLSESNNFPIEFRGFEEQEAKNVNFIMDQIGLKTDNIEVVNNAPTQRGNEAAIASFEPQNKVKNLYASARKHSRQAQIEAMTHEMGHSVSPLFPEHVNVYGSEAERLESADHAIKVANQSLATGKFMNGYHAYLAKNVAEAKASGNPEKEQQALMVFTEETDAIMMELRLNNPKQLSNAEKAQKRAMAQNGAIEQFTPIIEGVDKTIAKVSKNGESAEQIHKRLKHVRSGFLTPRRKILSEENAKAA